MVNDSLKVSKFNIPMAGLRARSQHPNNLEFAILAVLPRYNDPRRCMRLSWKTGKGVIALQSSMCIDLHISVCTILILT